MFGARVVRNTNTGIIPSANSNKGDAGNFNPNNDEHVNKTISELLVMINDVATTVPGPGGVVISDDPNCRAAIADITNECSASALISPSVDPNSVADRISRSIILGPDTAQRAVTDFDNKIKFINDVITITRFVQGGGEGQATRNALRGPTPVCPVATANAINLINGITPELRTIQSIFVAGVAAAITRTIFDSVAGGVGGPAARATAARTAAAALASNDDTEANILAALIVANPGNLGAVGLGASRVLCASLISLAKTAIFNYNEIDDLANLIAAITNAINVAIPAGGLVFPAGGVTAVQIIAAVTAAINLFTPGGGLVDIINNTTLRANVPYPVIQTLVNSNPNLARIVSASIMVSPGGITIQSSGFIIEAKARARFLINSYANAAIGLNNVQGGIANGIPARLAGGNVAAILAAPINTEAAYNSTFTITANNRNVVIPIIARSAGAADPVTVIRSPRTPGAPNLGRNSNYFYSPEIVKWNIERNSSVTPPPVLKPLDIFYEAKNLLNNKKQLILNLLEAANDIDRASADLNERRINDKDNTSGYSIKAAEVELNNVLDRENLDSPSINYRNLINVLHFHVANPISKSRGNKNVLNNLSANRIGLGGMFRADLTGNPLAVAAVNSLRARLKNFNRTQFLEAFDATVPGSQNYNYLVGLNMFGNHVNYVAINRGFPAAARPTNSIFKKLRELLVNPAEKDIFGNANGEASGTVANANDDDGQSFVFNTLQKIYDSYPTEESNTPTHKFLNHIIYAPTNLARVPKNWKWANEKEFLGYLRLTESDLKRLGKLLNINSDEVLAKLSNSENLIQSLKELRHLATSFSSIPKFIPNKLKYNTGIISLYDQNPELLRIYNMARKEKTKKTMAFIRPANVSSLTMGLPLGFSFLGGGDQSFPLDHPIEMRGGGYEIAAMKGGYPGLIGPFRPITDESFVSSSMELAFGTLRDRVEAAGATIDASTNTKINTLIKNLKDAELSVKNNRDNLIAMNNAISSGKYTPDKNTPINPQEIANIAAVYNSSNKSRQSLENKLTRVLITLGGVTREYFA